ncbi:MAG: 30S ribosomal protein S12 methylthiotransferase RimO [Oligoflexia bacterium]|nr:30S ribosomal protein S12 methylthiotransferase RimO [Oligoflexia bacterium]
MDKQRCYFVSLGCAKNLVDSEVMLGKMLKTGHQIIQEVEKADIIIVNTCSFIDIAKEESVETILEMARYKDPAAGKCKLLVVAGCMPQRYAGELESLLPEVDLFIGTGEYAKIDTHIENLQQLPQQKMQVGKPTYLPNNEEPRINTAPPYMAWLKISEGCDRHCSFCIIPKIRGDLRSRTVPSLLEEANSLVKNGVRELNLVAQDLSAYGNDLVPPSDVGKNIPLKQLLNSLQSDVRPDWIRLLYIYPDQIDIDLLKMIADSQRICHYLDIPVQHFADAVLKKMNRGKGVSGQLLLEKVQKIKEIIPDVVLRTSIIVGHPGESDKDFQMLLKGIEEGQFHNLGAFKYSDEEGTAAYNFEDKIPAQVINDRFKEVYKLQKKITAKLNKQYKEKVLDVLIEGAHSETDLLFQGRFYGQAPDIDGKVIINEGSARVGEIVKVKITQVHYYDLVGKIL